jgi:hypothetical protein
MRAPTFAPITPTPGDWAMDTDKNRRKRGTPQPPRPWQYLPRRPLVEMEFRAEEIPRPVAALATLTSASISYNSSPSAVAFFTSKATASDVLTAPHNSSLRSFVSNETVTTPVKYGAARGIFVIPLLSGSLSTFLMSNTSR